MEKGLIRKTMGGKGKGKKGEKDEILWFFSPLFLFPLSPFYPGRKRR
jgi:hypothetical protein